MIRTKYSQQPIPEKVCAEAVRLYHANHSLAAVGEMLGLSYAVTRRIVRDRTPLRASGGAGRREIAARTELDSLQSHLADALRAAGWVCLSPADLNRLPPEIRYRFT